MPSLALCLSQVQPGEELYSRWHTTGPPADGLSATTAQLPRASYSLPGARGRRASGHLALAGQGGLSQGSRPTHPLASEERLISLG